MRWAGPWVIAAIAVGTAIFARSLVVLRDNDVERRTLVLPICILTGTHLAALLQLIALWSPLLPERTSFDHGIDQIADQAPGRPGSPITMPTDQLPEPPVIPTNPLTDQAPVRPGIPTSAPTEPFTTRRGARGELAR